jgi:hypothetical protein
MQMHADQKGWMVLSSRSAGALPRLRDRSVHLRASLLILVHLRLNLAGWLATLRDQPLVAASGGAVFVWVICG